MGSGKTCAEPIPSFAYICFQITWQALCPWLSRSLPWDEWTSAAEKFVLWKMLVLGHWNYLGNIWLKNRGESQLKWKIWGEVYLWLMKNDNLYFVCVNFLFLRLFVISSVQSQMVLAFFFWVIPPGRKKISLWVRNHREMTSVRFIWNSSGHKRVSSCPGYLGEGWGLHQLPSLCHLAQALAGFGVLQRWLQNASPRPEHCVTGHLLRFWPGEMEAEETDRPLCASRDGVLTFPSKWMGVLFMGNLLGCQTRRSWVPNDDDPARITAGVSPPLPHRCWYLHPREMKRRISLLALAGLLENPGLNQEACLWYSSLSRKYYRCHFVAPKLLTRQHSYLIRHSTAIHIYLYLNSCPLYYTAGHASAPTPPY